VTALERVADLTAEIERAEDARAREVARAVHHGATWTEIGAALGVTAQSAHRRFRWLRWDPVTQRHWSEPPLPLR
jgi:hypothetical protein